MLATDERRQQRLEATYYELITFIARQREQFDAIRPWVTFPGEPETPTLQLAETYRARAVTIAHASTEVWALLEEFEEVCRSIVSADAALRGIEDTERQTQKPVPTDVFGGTSADYMKRLFEDKQRLADIEIQIHEQIRCELGSGPRTQKSAQQVKTLNRPADA